MRSGFSAKVFSAACGGFALLLVVFLTSCSAPLQSTGASAQRVSINLNYTNQLGSLAAPVAASTGSRLLLPTVASILLTLTDSGGYQITRSQPFGTGSATFTFQLLASRYTVKMQALDNAGQVQFANTGSLSVYPGHANVTANYFLLPVTVTAMAAGNGYSTSVASNGVVSYKFQLPSAGAPLTLSNFPAGLNYYLQDSTGAPVAYSAGVVAPGATDSALYITFWNNSLAPVNITGLAVAPTGSAWTSHFLPSAQNWTSITYGNGTFVSVAYNTTTAITSTDGGANWTPQPLLTATNKWQALTYGNGTFVAIATLNSNSVATSANGISWIGHTMPSIASWQAISYGNGKFVAIASNSNTAASTTDGGNSWTQPASPSLPNAMWQALSYGNGTFVAIATGGTTAATSTDGINWTTRTLPSAQSWQSITFGNGVFVAVAFGSAVAATSNDGINWTQRSLPNSTWQSVTYGNGLFMALSTTSTATSPDGITWSSLSTLAGSTTWQSMAYGNGVFVAVTNGGSNAATSP